MRYTAVTKEGKRLIAMFAESKEEAVRSFEIHLRGRPGPDLYKQWIKGGKIVITE